MRHRPTEPGIAGSSPAGVIQTRRSERGGDRKSGVAAIKAMKAMAAIKAIDAIKVIEVGVVWPALPLASLIASLCCSCFDCHYCLDFSCPGAGRRDAAPRKFV